MTQSKELKAFEWALVVLDANLKSVDFNIKRMYTQLESSPLTDKHRQNLTKKLKASEGRRDYWKQLKATYEELLEGAGKK